MKTAIIHALVQGSYHTVETEGGVITALYRETEGHAPHADRLIDAHGAELRPGLVEIHSHGCIGHDTMDGDALPELARAYRAAGVTTWYPTTMTESDARIRAALSQHTGVPGGACIPGFHLEGPYINPQYKGAQRAEDIRDPDPETFATYPHVALVTVAPERPGAMEFIRRATAAGVRVCLGHTACDYDTACAAFENGAVCLTHTCNAMPPFHHRDPGPIGAAIDCGAYVQVISDGLHLCRSMVTMLYRTCGPDRMILISDSMQATGLGDGTYLFGGQPVTVQGGVARTETGALAGSTTTLFGCVQQAIAFGIPEDDAYRMASETAAAMMGLHKGLLAPGYAAEFLLLKDGRLQGTLVLTADNA